ncbi:propanol-preferring alcohol dehydrogenase [Pedobacter cryoconitis]|uniref:Propanol-preferring alcohol dehydrogenase n=1 Tax=Pedobacter cryoconitis TaxID=188932 RepID=A0A7W8ZR21_9SPHI|nr:zinc-dependent alcohol dehydrogenase family protein [Pedobacter cryoconitis]MBB5638390.1 propanol-preferring alcohol dehydrogenase [Pedobacter cryoconitis]
MKNKNEEDIARSQSNPLQHNVPLAPMPKTMQAMVMEIAGQPLVRKTMPLPVANEEKLLIKIIACGVCRTDLHIMDSELANPKLPLIPGHEIIGTVEKAGRKVTTFKPGDLVGVPWLGYTCGYCKYCLKDQENLCENALFTGYTIDGGYAEYTVAFQKYCFHLGPQYGHPSSAPLLCAGLIGYRSYQMIGPEAKHIGFYGFGVAAHILVQIAKHEGKEIYAFTRDGDLEAQSFATRTGAVWAGNSTDPPPVLLEGAIIFAPVGQLVPKALKDIDKGCAVICGGIHMSDIPSFAYQLLWEERTIRSVANLTRKDGDDFFELADKIKIKIETRLFPLQQANEALAAVRNGDINGAAVLVM